MSAGALSTKSGAAELGLDAGELLLDLGEVALQALAHLVRIDDAAQRHEDLAEAVDDRRRLAARPLAAASSSTAPTLASAFMYGSTAAT